MIVDLYQSDEWTDEVSDLSARCLAELVAIVGDDEAQSLLEVFGGNFVIELT